MLIKYLMRKQKAGWDYSMHKTPSLKVSLESQHLGCEAGMSEFKVILGQIVKANLGHMRKGTREKIKK